MRRVFSEWHNAMSKILCNVFNCFLLFHVSDAHEMYLLMQSIGC